jgi:uncharacterized protein with NRDE domain
LESIFNLLQDNKPADDKHLPDTGIGLEAERILSSIFVKTESFGTRCSTLVMINNHNEVDFIEKTYHPDEDRMEETKFHFPLHLV